MSVTIVTTEKEVITKVEVKTVQLELSMHQAEVLMFVLGNIGGNPESSYRNTTEKIFYMLANSTEIRDMSSEIDFNNIMTPIIIEDYIHPDFPLED